MGIQQTIGGSGRILVVDDDLMLLRLFTMVLDREGYQVYTSETGTNGLQLALTGPFDVVLLDINLPDMSGIEVMRQIITATASPVILITGDETNYSYDSALREGATDFIVKPIRFPELFQRIQQARQVRALAEAKEQQLAHLTRLATRDELTGLFNRRHFHEKLKAEFQRAQRYQHGLSLGMFDIDLFKEINDTQGHAEGDRVLIGVARILSSIIRATDAVFRFGGDEIAILIPETSGSQALAMADKIRQAVAQAELVPGVRVTISGGIAEFQPDEDPGSLLRRADAALYEAKRAGRNRVFLG